MLYPVLRELEETMRTTLIGMDRAHYPPDRLRVICIPNADDHDTIAAAQKLAQEFPFLEVLPVPPTSDPTWQVVWDRVEPEPEGVLVARRPPGRRYRAAAEEDPSAGLGAVPTRALESPVHC